MPSRNLMMMGAAGAGGDPGVGLYTWGQGAYGQLGDGTTTNRSSPVLVAENVSTIGSGQTYGFYIDSDGKLWATGSNGFGQLGLGDQTDRSSWTQVGSDTDWTKIMDGSGNAIHHAAGTRLISVNRLFTWGRNQHGQLGKGDTIDRSSPTQTEATNWLSLCLGENYTLAVRDGDYLFATGINNYGQLGKGDTSTRFSFTNTSLVGSTSPIAAGKNHTVYVDSATNRIYSVGRNQYGQLGQNDTTDRSSYTQIGAGTDWATVAAGHDHTLAIKTNGTLWAWGYNGYGQLGDGAGNFFSSPVQIGSLTNWSSVAAYGASSFAIKTDGTLWAWGANYSGQLGLDDTTLRLSPVQVGTETNWLMVRGGTVNTNGVTLGLRGP